MYQNFKLVEITFIRSLFDQVIQQVLELHGLVPHEFEQRSASGKLQYPKPTKKSCLIFELKNHVAQGAAHLILLRKSHSANVYKNFKLVENMVHQIFDYYQK